MGIPIVRIVNLVCGKQLLHSKNRMHEENFVLKSERSSKFGEYDLPQIIPNFLLRRILITKPKYIIL